MRTARQSIEGMALVFDSAAAEDLTAAIQFDVSGAEPGVYHLDIADGSCHFHEGPSRAPTLTVSTPSDVWERISHGEISGRDALLDGLYEVEGDASLLMRLDRLFGRPAQAAVAASDCCKRPGPVSLSGSHWLTVAFVPWLLLWFGQVLGLEGAASVHSAFAVAAALVAYHARYGSATWFELGSAIVLGSGAVVALTEAGPSILGGWGSAADSLALGLIWLFSLLHAPRPLTADYSRWDHAESLADNSTFLHVNRVLTLMWGTVFVLMGAMAVAGHRWPQASGVLTTSRLLLLLPAIVATVRLPRVAARLRIENIDGWRSRIRLTALAGALVALAVIVTAAAAF
jgi:putative sterol carrier protein